MSLWDWVGKYVRVTFKNGTPPIFGKCVDYDEAEDNERGIASIDVDPPETDGYSYSLYENEIKSITEYSPQEP